MGAIDRRTFLVTGGLALAGLATACKKKPRSLPAHSTLEQLVADVKKRDTAIQQIQAVEQILVRPQSRIAFALVSADNTTQYKGGSVKVWWSPIGSTAPARGPVPAEFHGDGLGDKGVYVARLDIDTAGNWNVLAVGKPDGLSTEAWAGAAYPAIERVAGPGPGAKAVSVATPTVDNHRGVNPYCTRTPPCSMHAISLDVALANGRPTVFVIGTPRFCTSRVCGPVVDVLQTVSGAFAGRVNFIHAEVYKNDTDAPAKQILAPAAAAWRLENEPVVYWIQPDNTITERIVGPTDIAEVREITQALVAG
jgi:hypothetical protein